MAEKRKTKSIAGGRFDGPVVILRTEESIAAGVAGAIGMVVGATVPSGSGVEPIVGGAPDDVAVAVEIQAVDRPVWLNPELLVEVRYPERVAALLDDE